MFEHSRIHTLMDEINEIDQYYSEFNQFYSEIDKEKHGNKYTDLLDRLIMEIEAYTSLHEKIIIIIAAIKFRGIPLCDSNNWHRLASKYDKIILGRNGSHLISEAQEPAEEFANLKTDEEAMIFRLTRL